MKAHFHLRQNSCKFDFVTQFGTVNNSVDPIYSPRALFLCFSCKRKYSVDGRLRQFACGKWPRFKWRGFDYAFRELRLRKSNPLIYFFLIKKANIFLIILYLMLIIMQNAFTLPGAEIIEAK